MSKVEQNSIKNSGKLVKLGGILLALIGFSLLGSGLAIWYLNGSLDAEGYTLSNVYTVNVPQNVFLISIRTEHPGMLSSFMMNFLKPEDVHQGKWIVQSDNSKQLLVEYATSQETNALISNREFTALDYTWDSGFYYSTLTPYQVQTYNKGGSTISVTDATGINWLSQNLSSGTSVIHFNPFFGESNELRTLLIMNADGSPGVNADIRLGWRIPFLDWMFLILLPIGALFLIIGILLITRR